MGKKGGASRWRVCYQRGLPRLVFWTNIDNFTRSAVNKYTMPFISQQDLFCLPYFCIPSCSLWVTTTPAVISRDATLHIHMTALALRYWSDLLGAAAGASLYPAALVVEPWREYPRHRDTVTIWRHTLCSGSIMCRTWRMAPRWVFVSTGVVGENQD